MREHKRLFVFLQRNAEFQSFIQMVIRFVIAKYKISKTIPNCHLIFHNERQNFENCTQAAICNPWWPFGYTNYLFPFTKKGKILKTVAKLPFDAKKIRNFENSI